MLFTAEFLLALAGLSSLASAGTNYVKFTNVGFSGSYKDVTDFDSCSTTVKSFSGDVAPYDEDLSVHIRGPINLKNFAVYYPSGSSSKRDVECEDEVNLKRNVHHIHKRDNVYTVDVTQTITVTELDDGETTTAAPAAVASSSSAEAVVAAAEVEDKAATSSSSSAAKAAETTVAAASSSSAAAASSSSSSSSGSGSSSSGSDWTRSSYYDASSKSSSNVSFLKHKSWSNKIEYCDASGTGSSSSAVTLGDVTLESDQEVILFSGASCDSSCGAYNDGIPAKKGWAGAEKIFAFKFKMPTATKSSTNNNDMPAIWMLNGRIPRTDQYGSCSCWNTGCGEFDVWEVITAAAANMKVAFHNGRGIGLSHAAGSGSDKDFVRPVNDYMTGVVIFYDNEIVVTEVDNFDFDSGLSSSTVKSWINKGSYSKAL